MSAFPPGSTCNCDVCGQPVAGWTVDYPGHEVTEEWQPLWEGGPPVPVPLYMPRWEREIDPRTGKPLVILTVEPCGHRVESFTVHSPPTPARP